MTTTKALVNVRPGHAEVQNIPVPELEPGYIRVRPTAWAINPDDAYHLGLEVEESCSGAIIGTDYAGVVVEVGPGVERDFKVGDRIAGGVVGQNILRKHDGAFAHLIHVKGDIHMKVPDNMSDQDAATQGVALITMGVGLYQHLHLPLPDEPAKQPFPVFIYGGSTAMGTTAIQLAKLGGATVISTSSPANADYVKFLGADHVLDYNSDTLVDDILKLSGGPILHVFDTHPNLTSITTSAAILQKSPSAIYISLNPGLEREVKRLNPDVTAEYILAYSATGNPWMYENKFFEAVRADYAFQKKFVKVAEKLFQEGLLKPARVYLNRGGSGLEGILKGLVDIKEGKVSGGKLVYTRE
ncbi:ToxD-like protein [Fusarium denticulatum]|uniref:ToxD-like protein n=1 Tax=Fusarium denticulatum TaxID=48507 RepID=A0A8H5X026_9HYPO|nr:ToxD-like protein [Fusarium denticulatum]